MRNFNIHRQKTLSTNMKTTEELHAEAAVNLRAIHASYFHKDCFLACVIALLAAAVIALLI